MILFWIIAGVLTLAAAVVLAAPLFDTRKFKSEDAVEEIRALTCREIPNVLASFQMRETERAD